VPGRSSSREAAAGRRQDGPPARASATWRHGLQRPRRALSALCRRGGARDHLEDVPAARAAGLARGSRGPALGTDARRRGHGGQASVACARDQRSRPGHAPGRRGRAACGPARGRPGERKAGVLGDLGPTDSGLRARFSLTGPPSTGPRAPGGTSHAPCIPSDPVGSPGVQNGREAPGNPLRLESSADAWIRWAQCMKAPPFMSRPWPVTPRASGEHSQATRPATSSGSLMRPSGTACMAMAWACSGETPSPAAMPSMP